jgi:hypothetical protein
MTTRQPRTRWLLFAPADIHKGSALDAPRVGVLD